MAERVYPAPIQKKGGTTTPVLKKDCGGYSFPALSAKERAVDYLVKMVEDPASLKFLFLKRDYRKIRHDGTVSLHNQLFEVPPVYIGQRIELRYDEALKQVFVFTDGKPVAEAKAVNLADNARVKRERPALSFAELTSG